jgi:TonB-linked SusC/RagA family outer membrane protein
MRKIVSLLAVLMLLSIAALAQKRTVTGQVRDNNNQPVPFATVSETGTSNTVSADDNGAFSISIREGATLTISSSGFNAITHTPGPGVQSIALTANNNMQEVIVTTAMGVQRQSKELGYSTAKVRGSELTAARPTNLQNGLTAKVSGLNIMTTNNGVFGDTRITLRGIRSLTGNNQPMLILDGVPIGLGYLSSINPNDIADVTVLKSSSATAVYGSDGVNGAIIVTTKRGTRGRPVISVSNSTQLEKISYMPKFQERYGSGYSTDPNGYGIYDPVEQQSWGPEFNGEMVELGEPDPNGNIQRVPYSYIKNGRRDFFNTGITNQTDVSFSTGDFYLSAQNVDIKGVMPDDENHRRAVTLRSDREYGRFKAGFNLRYTNQSSNVANNNRAVYYTVTGAPGHINLRNYKDWRNDYFSSPDGYYTTFLGNFGKTPYFAKDNYRSTQKGDDIFGNTELSFKATSWLGFMYRLSAAISNTETRNTVGAFTHSAFHQTRHYPSDVNVAAQVSDQNLIASRITSEFNTNFNKRFAQFGLQGMLGYQYRTIRQKQLIVGSGNLGTSEFLSVVARKGEPNVTVDNSRTRMDRFFGRLSFDWDQKIFIEGTASYDRDSRLVPASGVFENKDIDFFYPGVSTSILLHELIPGIKNNKIMNYFKLRGAWSKTGSLAALNAYDNESTFGTGLFFPYGSVSGYTVGTTFYPPQLLPEFVVNKEAGVELGFVNGRINIEATYYNQDNTDQIIPITISNTTGYTKSFLNAASFKNSGVEVDLRLTPLVKLGSVNVDFKINYTHQSNEVYKLVDGVDELGIGNFNYVIVGQSAYMFKLTDYIRDPLGRVVVDRVTGMPTANPNLTMFGKTMPDNILGLNLGITWKDLSFSATADYRTGNQIVADELGGFLDDNGISERSAQNGRRAFVWPNSVYDDGTGKFVVNNDIFTQTYGREFWNSALNTSVTSNYLADGSFWKLREVALNYNLPVRNWFGGNVVKSIMVGVSGRNLFMWLPESNQWTDPEFSANGGNSYTGNATGRSTAYNMPPTRNFAANISVQF